MIEAASTGPSARFRKGWFGQAEPALDLDASLAKLSSMASLKMLSSGPSDWCVQEMEGMRCNSIRVGATRGRGIMPCDVEKPMASMGI
jgi:hypothetical protein